MAALRRDWINQLVVTSGAPTRSIDHHFKGGKPTGAAALRHCARPAQSTSSSCRCSRSGRERVSALCQDFDAALNDSIASIVQESITSTRRGRRRATECHDFVFAAEIGSLGTPRWTGASARPWSHSRGSRWSRPLASGTDEAAGGDLEWLHFLRQLVTSQSAAQRPVAAVDTGGFRTGTA
jgi:hypothetical protein